MNGSIQAKGETEYFEKEFTATTTDFNCAIVLEFKGSGTVKVEHLSLIAIESEKVTGDVNADGKFNMVDIALLKKWLLGITNVTLADWKTADLCEDGKLNVFDLCAMKQNLISNK